MHPLSVHIFYSKSRISESNGNPAHLLLIYYCRQLARSGVNYLLNALNGHILLLCQLLEGNAVQQLALEDGAIALIEDPFVNKRRPLRAG